MPTYDLIPPEDNLPGLEKPVTWCLLELVNNSIRRQQANRSKVGFLGEMRWCKDICTISLNAGRGSGHTEAAVELVRHLKGTLIVLPNMNLARAFNKIANQFSKKFSNNVVVRDAKTGIRGVGFLFSFQAVIFDCASLMEPEDIEEFYEAFLPEATGRPFVFVKLG